jgi:hypothetical protein
LPIAAMYSHASPIVRSVPPSLVGRGEVSFLERYAELNMGAKNSKHPAAIIAVWPHSSSSCDTRVEILG